MMEIGEVVLHANNKEIITVQHKLRDDKDGFVNDIIVKRYEIDPGGLILIESWNA